MGWKNVKEHYRIGHIVQVREEEILIGSPYVSDLITIHRDGTLKWGSLGPSSNDDLARYYKEMTADQAKLVELMNAPDTFGESVTVYTYDGGDIIEKQCEKPGWPNATHDGDMMYQNTYSTDKAKVVLWAKENADAGIRIVTDRIDELKRDLSEREARLENYKQHRAKLEADYPSDSTK